MPTNDKVHQRSSTLRWMTVCSRYAGLARTTEEPERVTCAVCIAGSSDPRTGDAPRT